MKNGLKTCYCCAVAQDEDYTSLFDLTGRGEVIVNICTDCWSKIQSRLPGRGQWGDESLCNHCGRQGSCGGDLHECLECLEQRYVQEMHDALPTFTTGEVIATDADGMVVDSNIGHIIKNEKEYTESFVDKVSRAAQTALLLVVAFTLSAIAGTCLSIVAQAAAVWMEGSR